MTLSKEQVSDLIRKKDVLTLSSNQTKIGIGWFSWVTSFALANPKNMMDDPLSEFVCLTNAVNSIGQKLYTNREVMHLTLQEYEYEINCLHVEIENILDIHWLATTNQGQDIYIIHNLETNEFILVQNDLDNDGYNANFYEIKQAWFKPVLSYQSL